ncbi:MAG TPA: nucleotide pyrophosphohydrolase [Clostridia bacterium]|nr:nucleotide pyrophosphohydrolase [Clostridia bacterium]HRX42637.1 nucleotide pyrophosphohydrolase [Clostridia bacterium]
MKELIEEIIRFRDQRNWKKYHTPANLAKSISIEAAELLENFQWDDNYDHENMCDELADIMIYSIMAADAIGVDIEEIIKDKMKKNALKYPAEEIPLPRK